MSAGNKGAAGVVSCRTTVSPWSHRDQDRIPRRRASVDLLDGLPGPAHPGRRRLRPFAVGGGDLGDAVAHTAVAANGLTDGRFDLIGGGPPPRGQVAAEQRGRAAGCDQLSGVSYDAASVQDSSMGLSVVPRQRLACSVVGVPGWDRRGVRGRPSAAPGGVRDDHALSACRCWAFRSSWPASVCLACSQEGVSTCWPQRPGAAPQVSGTYPRSSTSVDACRPWLA